MPCANCRRDLTASVADDGDNHDNDDSWNECHAFLLRIPKDDEPGSGNKPTVTDISIAAAITTIFEASLKLHKKQVSPKCRLLMCFNCLSTLTALTEAYSKFMNLTTEGSYIQQLIETSVLWPSFATPRRFNFAYDDYTPLVEVKLEPAEQTAEFVLTSVKEEDPDFLMDDDPLRDSQDDDEGHSKVPLRRSTRKTRGVKRKGKRTPQRSPLLKKRAKQALSTGSGARARARSKVKTKLKTVPKEKKVEVKSSSSPKEKTIKRLLCPEEGCTKSFNDEKLFRRHVKYKHGNATPEEMAARTCTECPTPKIFGIPSQLRLHQLEVHSTDTPFPCTKCDRQFPTANRLRIHSVLKHPSSSQTATAREPLICPHKCETPFRSKVSLKLHLKSVHGERLSYSCEECGKNFHRGTRYRRHMKYKHGQGLTAEDLEGRACPDCPKVYETRGQLKSHQASAHSTEKPFECDVPGCGKKFPSKNYLNIHWHMRHKKENVRYPCEHCGKSYCSKPVLQEHVETVHRGVRNSICEICGKACTRQSALNRHMETHDMTRQKQFECNICNQRFISEKTLKTHAITHSGVRDQQCTHCGDTFLHVASLRRHLHAKHGIRPTTGPDSKEGHECKQCGKVFKLKEYLSQHLRSRTHGGKGHTAQRRREAADSADVVLEEQDQEPLDGRKFKRVSANSVKGNMAGKNRRVDEDKKLLDHPAPFVELNTPLPQQIFWAHDSIITPGSSQYFRQ